MKDSGTYTFKKDDLFQQAAELTKPIEVPLIVSGPVLALYALKEAVDNMLIDIETMKVNTPGLKEDLEGWQKSIEHAISDEKFEHDRS